ncbi:hypothetical protein AOXY_G9189 [Acipenser oxyrinchus oxyrinchus]|uniref:Uncharacterized protein n=1 Tax=Acipenser oxyrinchus oxyrinchus TaxID=40147 RepID=A0AAD8DEV2_ACIOX|nr:hypothetical protein AOXY_G9189 [Acipenser oxyrinchus oxyrinchus]
MGGAITLKIKERNWTHLQTHCSLIAEEKGRLRFTPHLQEISTCLRNIISLPVYLETRTQPLTVHHIPMASVRRDNKTGESVIAV